MEEFQKDSVKIRDKKNVENKLETIMKGGPRKLQVKLEINEKINLTYLEIYFVSQGYHGF